MGTGKSKTSIRSVELDTDPCDDCSHWSLVEYKTLIPQDYHDPLENFCEKVRKLWFHL